MGEWRYSSTVLLLDGGDRSASRPGRFTPREGPRYPLERSLDRRLRGTQSRSGCWEEKNLSPSGNRTPDIQPVDCRYTDWAIPTPNVKYITLWHNWTPWWRRQKHPPKRWEPPRWCHNLEGYDPTLWQFNETENLKELPTCCMKCTFGYNHFIIPFLRSLHKMNAWH
jgi:hypothetical protein